METHPINADGFAANARARSLADELTELCAYRYALDARFLTLLRQFDEERSWERLGFGSCAHWMNLKCGIGLNAAREQVRVAHALANLSKISAAFAEGKLSYSKVRAMTRIADAANEDYLLMIATHGTAYHVETLVRKYRWARKLNDLSRVREPMLARSLDWCYDDDGMLVLKARLPAEQGALVVRALEQAMESAEAEGISANPVPLALATDVTAVTPLREPKHARKADGLVALAETFLAEPKAGGSSAERYRIVVHVSAETLRRAERPEESIPDVTAVTSDAEPRRLSECSHLENGPHVTAETSRRLACDAALVGLLEDAEGIPLSVGRQTRSIPAGIRRALQARDGGCRFPGCTHTRFVDGHHIRHWANGGETSLDNLVLLCRHHHRLVHEGGFHCERTVHGEVVFTSPAEERLEPYADLPGIDSGEDPVAWLTRQVDTKHIDHNTCVTQWYAGERMDWHLAVANLM